MLLIRWWISLVHAFTLDSVSLYYNMKTCQFENNVKINTKIVQIYQGTTNNLQLRMVKEFHNWLYNKVCSNDSSMYILTCDIIGVHHSGQFGRLRHREGEGIERTHRGCSGNAPPYQWRHRIGFFATYYHLSFKWTVKIKCIRKV